MSNRLHYSEFWDRINVTAFEEAIGFNVEYERGDNDVGFCLFPENHAHGDTTGKFAIHREDRLYNCYLCGGGTLLSLVMQLRDLDVGDATDWLYQFTEEDMRSDSEFMDEFMQAFADTEKRVETLPYFNPRVLEKYDEPLEDAMEWDEDKQAWVPFLVKRWIRPDIAELFGVRYCSEMRRKPPVKGKFADDDPYAGPAIIFPHYHMKRLVGWQCRWLDPDRPEWVPKYTMSSDFPKETTLYGWDTIQWHAMKAGGPVVVIESVPSALFLESCDQAAIATFGSSINDAQLRLLRQLQGGVILIPDNDIPKNPDATPAGIKWRDTITKYLKRYVPVWHLPPVGEKAGADIGDYASYDKPEEALNEYLCQMYQPGIDL